MEKEPFFKAIPVDGGEPVYGYYVKCRNHFYILPAYNGSGYDERWETNEWVAIKRETLVEVDFNEWLKSE